MDAPIPPGSAHNAAPLDCSLGSPVTRTDSHRPVVVTLLSCFLILGTVATAVSVVPNFHEYRMWFRVFISFSMVGTVIAAVGMWRMRPWSVYAYGSLVLVSVVVVSYLDVINLLAIGIRLAVITVAFHYICRRARFEPPLSSDSNAVD